MIVPYVIGAGIGGGMSIQVLAGLAGVLMLFFSRAALAPLLKSRAVDGSFGPDLSIRLLNSGIFFVAGGGFFVYLMTAGGVWQLGVAAAAGAGLFLVHELLVWRRRERSVAAEMIGVALLTLTAPVAVFLSSCDSCGRLAGILWLLNAMFFGASIFYVKMRLRTSARRRRPGTISERILAARASMVYLAATAVILVLLAVSQAIPPEAVLAFVPMFIYQAWGMISGAGSMTLKAEGIAQTTLSVIFLLAIIAAFRF